MVLQLLTPIVVASTVSIYPAYMWQENVNYSRALESHLIQLEYDATNRGCPVFYPSTAIVIAGTDPVAMRAELHRVANDVDKFHTDLEKVLKRDGIRRELK